MSLILATEDETIQKNAVDNNISINAITLELKDGSVVTIWAEMFGQIPCLMVDNCEIN